MRIHEKHYATSHYIMEYWNTLSNLPFIIIGFLRLFEGHLFDLYLLYILAGFCSGFHHAYPMKYSIVIDWIPIASSMVLMCVHGVIFHITFVTWFKVLLALLSLFMDHVFRIVPVPWGHVLWHILAALAIDDVYQDFLFA